MECDALSIVRLIRDKKGTTPIFIIYDDIIEICNSFSTFDCVHVKQTRNTVAHSVARWKAVLDYEIISTNMFPKLFKLWRN